MYLNSAMNYHLTSFYYVYSMLKGKGPNDQDYSSKSNGLKCLNIGQ